MGVRPGPGLVGAMSFYGAVRQKLVDEVYKGRLHRTWAKGIREDILGDKKHYFSGTTDADLLSDVVVQLRTEFASAGLELASFDLDDPQALVVGKVNALLYDVLGLIIERHSNAHVWLTGTDASADRDGRRALVDIVKRSVPVALRESFQQEHAALSYPANVDPQPVLAREQRLVRDDKATDWTPTETTMELSLYSRLDPVFYAAVKVRYPMVADLAAVSLGALRSLVVEIYQAWAQTDVGKAFLAKPAAAAGSAAAAARAAAAAGTPAAAAWAAPAGLSHGGAVPTCGGLRSRRAAGKAAVYPLQEDW
ncbi:hypothetical protein CYMTET_49285 [Cymbomonas tetramitiformis]|uniref:Uncharacterized protein n=1 Tax=Cymbomonas tetramitiformis TaxID=36881 RepID=A0AAE0EVX7_9CHLO|nr:hypothetical protein CYMTET_49285 [Cymbomonas tetramitiformis]